jgi:hypothetical protein
MDEMTVDQRCKRRHRWGLALLGSALVAITIAIVVRIA